MTENKIPTAQIAYGEGLLAGITRKLENSNPYPKNKTLLSKAWLGGHKKGKQIVIYHTKGLRNMEVPKCLISTK